MATKNGTGAATRLNSPQEHPREGKAGQERAWLTGLAWLSGLTPAERDVALATAATPAQTHDDGTPSRAETLLDIAGEIRRWGSVGLFGAADRLEAVAQEMAADAPTSAIDPLSFTLDAERLRLILEAVFQCEALADATIGKVTQWEDNGPYAALGFAIRMRDLVPAVMELAGDKLADMSHLHRTVRGTRRDGAAS